jgi:hypothetical protein
MPFRPNVTPLKYRALYEIYPGKVSIARPARRHRSPGGQGPGSALRPG